MKKHGFGVPWQLCTLGCKTFAELRDMQMPRSTQEPGHKTQILNFREG